MTRIRTMFLALGLALGGAVSGPALAQQSPFSPVISVNDAAVTGYEIDQRSRLLSMFNTPGNLTVEARRQLVDERLQQQELDRLGVTLDPAVLRAEMEAFAGRVQMPLDQFLQVLAGAGVSEETLRDYVAISVTWRDYVRARYNSRVTITDADIDLAISQMGRSNLGIEVLLSEIIIPAPPPQAAQAMALAEQISQSTSLAQFEAAARQYSALPSRDVGGRLDWVALANFPPGLHGLILSMSPGDVTPPIPIENGVALFQLRNLREGAQIPVEIALVDYAVFYTSGAEEAQNVVDRVDTCNDLYGVAYGLPQERLLREEVAPAAIPQDIALELARLDRDEIARMTRADGSVAVVMLCNRIPAAAVDVDRAVVANQLRGERLAGYANALVQDLRASAVILGE